MSQESTSGNPDEKGVVFNIQDYSVHDGPGIRTLVFLKGCPLRCNWCSNPEGQRFRPEIMHSKVKCKKCMRCSSACPDSAVSTGRDSFPKFRRTICIKCAEKPCSVTCPQRAIHIAGQYLSAKAAYERIKENSLFFRNSGGGVTLSGGEPLAQPVFVRQLLKLCNTVGISVGVETSGHFKWSTVSDFIGDLDFFFYDIKCMDSVLHKQVTGKGNRLILQNIEKLAKLDASKITISVPIIPGVIDSEENMLATIELSKKLGITKIRLLQYHELGRGKYEDLGRPYKMPSNQIISKDTMSALREIVEKHKIECTIL